MGKKADPTKIPKAATGKTNLVWVKREIKDSVYNDHWEFKLADINYAKRYNSGYFKRTNWEIMKPKDKKDIEVKMGSSKPKLGTIEVDVGGVDVIKGELPEKKVAKARLKIV